MTCDMGPEDEDEETELELDTELELVVVADEDCTEEVASEVFVVVEVSEVGSCELWLAAVDVAVLCGEVMTYAAPSKTRATTKAAAATCALLAPALFKETPPSPECGPSSPGCGPRAGLQEARVDRLVRAPRGSESLSRFLAPPRKPSLGPVESLLEAL